VYLLFSVIFILFMWWGIGFCSWNSHSSTNL